MKNRNIFTFVFILISINLLTSKTKIENEYKVKKIEQCFNSDFDLIIFERNDSLFHTFVEKNKLNEMEVIKLFELEGTYNIELDFKESLFANHPFIISNSLDSLRENKYSSTFTLENIDMSTIVVYEIKNLNELLFPLSSSTTNIDLKKIDIEWKYELDFYTNHNDILSIVDDTLLLTHYSKRTDIETLKSAYFENIYKFDKNSGELLEYKFKDDSLTARDIAWSLKYEKYAYRRTWPASFNMESDFDIIIDLDESRLFHNTTRSYKLNIFKDEEKYKISLDELGKIRIEFYLKYSNELYLWIHSDNKDYNRVGSFLYKLNIDELIQKYK